MLPPEGHHRARALWGQKTTIATATLTSAGWAQIVPFPWYCWDLPFVGMFIIIRLCKCMCSKGKETYTEGKFCSML